MKYYDQLIKATIDEDFYTVNDILELIKKDDDSIEYVAEILIYMENNPNVDYGLPGPLVHYMERYFNNGYEELLYSSIERKPTTHTLWMLNRVLNSPVLEGREKYLTALKNVAENNNVSDTIREYANFYFQYQMNNKSE